MEGLLPSYEARVLLFFVYGLAFFTMGLAVRLEARRGEGSAFAESLLYLSLFGLVHGVVEWGDMFSIILSKTPSPSVETALTILHRVLLPTSLLFLLLFGVKLVVSSMEEAKRLWWLPPALFAAWLAVGLLPLGYSSLAGQNAFSPDQGVKWQEAWARYLLYFPGSLLAAYGLLLQRQAFFRLRMPNIAQYTLLAAGAFILNAGVAGLIVPETPFPPAQWINYTSFTQKVGVPPQVFRAVSAIVIAFSVIRILRYFELAQRREVAQAQKETLRVQEMARKQAEERGHTLEEAVAERTKQLEALARINTEMSTLMDIDRILDTVVEKAGELLKVDVATISLFNGGGAELEVRAVKGVRSPAFKEIRMALGHGVAGKAVALGKPVITQNYALDPEITHELNPLMEEEGLVSHLAVPMNIGGKTIGAIFVANRSPRLFSPGEAEVLSQLAQQAAIAIDNARLYQQVSEIAVFKERERLSRELHDSLAQAIGFLRLEGSHAAQLLNTGDLAGARASLEEIDRGAELAYSDVREAILGLRSTVISGGDLISILREYLHIFGMQNQIKTELKVEPGLSYALSPKAEVQLIRIIQEALTNVRKHAKASRVQVSFSSEDHGVRIEVKDNGQGFDRASLARLNRPHFGLNTMKERAESFGGSLEVESSPGSGTKVTVWVPLLSRKEASDGIYSSYGGRRPEAVP